MEENINSLVRKIDDNISIRKGKYGDYIFYKTEKNCHMLLFYRNRLNVHIGL